VFSDPVLISSFKNRQQAWHIDSPLPNVYVNLLYLDAGLMTQFMVPAALSEDVLHLRAPIEEKFSPFGGQEDHLNPDSKSEAGDQVAEAGLHQKWYNYLERR
jgi:hypothetical protein